MSDPSKRLRARTSDRGPPSGGQLAELQKRARTGDRSAFHTTVELGPNRALQPNGNLICYDVPLARAGWMMYGPGELKGLPLGKENMLYVERTVDELYSPKFISSIMGAAVVDGHPREDVTPNNWSVLAGGFAATNIRQGTTDDGESVLLGDLVITRKDLIEELQRPGGRREVSLGYDADYTSVAPGVAVQKNLVCNHIALVDRGRCGPRCAIGDREYEPQPLKKEPTMTTRKVIASRARTPIVSDEIVAARQRVTDAAAELEELEAAENGINELPGDTHIHIHTDPGARQATADNDPDPDDTATRLTKIEKTVETLSATVGDSLKKVLEAVEKKATNAADDGDDDEGLTDEEKKAKADKKKRLSTGDSAALETGFKAVTAQAEVLVPGFRMPTFDAALPREVTIEAMCGARRKAMDAAYATADGAALINTVAGLPTVDLAKLDCKEVSVLFNAATGAKALLNQAKTTTNDGAANTGLPANKGGGEIISAQALNKANEEFWAKRGGAVQ